MGDLGLVPVQLGPEAWRHIAELLACHPDRDAMSAVSVGIISARLAEMERAFAKEDGKLEYRVTATLKAA